MKLAETRLDEHAVADVIELYYSHPKLHIGRNVFIDMILHCPPKVTLKSLPGAVSRELDMLLAFRYREAAGALYDWSKMFGVCPYKMVRVPGSDVHAYPVVPDLGTGFIVTYVGKDERQHFKWYRTPPTPYVQPQEDRAMNWWIVHRGQIPTIAGTLRSSVATLLPDYRTQRILRESTEIGSWHGVRPLHVIEHHPPKSATGAEEHLTTLESFGEDIAGLVMHESERLEQKKRTIRTAELLSAVRSTHVQNSDSVHTAFGASETEEARREREDTGLSKRVLPLPNDRVYRAVSGPKLLGDLNAVTQRLDVNCAAIMDFPLEMLQSTSKAHAANTQGNSRFWNERAKHWIGEFERFYKHTLLMAYGDVLQEGLNKVVKLRRQASLQSVMQLYATTELTVEMPCSPMANWDVLRDMCDYGLIDKEAMGRHAFSNAGLPASELHVRDVEAPAPKKPRTESIV